MHDKRTQDLIAAGVLVELDPEQIAEAETQRRIKCLEMQMEEIRRALGLGEAADK